MIGYSTRDITNYSVRGGTSRAQLNRPTTNTFNQKMSNMNLSVIKLYREFTNLETRSQALVNAGLVKQEDHNKMFNNLDEFNVENIRFYIEKSERALTEAKKAPARNQMIEDPKLREVCTRFAEAYAGAWRKR